MGYINLKKITLIIPHETKILHFYFKTVIIILIMYFSNLLTCLLNVGRLIKISGAKIKIFGDLLLPLLSAVTVSMVSNTVLKLVNLQNNLVYIMFLTSVSCILYVGILFYLEIIPKKSVKTLVK